MNFTVTTVLRTYAALFGTPTDDASFGIQSLVAAVANDADWTMLEHVAYFFATIHHETGQAFQPNDEGGSDAHFNQIYAGVNGNTQPGDGARFHGRGYVQLTGRQNYMNSGQKLGLDDQLVQQPDDALDPNLAYLIAARGMREGWFTGRKLDDFILSGRPPDYINARRIINHLDLAEAIATIAGQWETILRSATVTGNPAIS
jgi:putative chitinase